MVSAGRSISFDGPLGGQFVCPASDLMVRVEWFIGSVFGRSVSRLAGRSIVAASSTRLGRPNPVTDNRRGNFLCAILNRRTRRTRELVRGVRVVRAT